MLDTQASLFYIPFSSKKFPLHLSIKKSNGGFFVFTQYPVNKTLAGKLRVRNLGVSLLWCPSYGAPAY
jgi:hypothetical protein